MSIDGFSPLGGGCPAFGGGRGSRPARARFRETQPSFDDVFGADRPLARPAWSGTPTAPGVDSLETVIESDGAMIEGLAPLPAGGEGPAQESTSREGGYGGTGHHAATRKVRPTATTGRGWKFQRITSGMWLSLLSWPTNDELPDLLEDLQRECERYSRLEVSLPCDLPPPNFQEQLINQIAGAIGLMIGIWSHDGQRLVATRNYYHKFVDPLVARRNRPYISGYHTY